MNSSDLSFKEKIFACVRILSYSPGLATLTLIFSFVAALLEGFGLSFILPIIELMREGSPAVASSEGPVRYFHRVFHWVGVPLSVGSAVCTVILIMGFRFGSTFLTNYLAGRFRMQYVRYLQEQTFSKVLGAKLSYFDRQGSSTVLNAVITQSRKVGMNLIRPALNVVELGFIIFVYLLIAVYLSFQLMLVTAVIVGIVALLLKWGTSSGEKLGDEVAGANEKLQKIAQASAQGIRELKTFNQSSAFYDRFRREQNRHCRHRIQLIKNRELIRNLYNFVTIVAVFGLIYVALEYTSLQLGALGLFLVILFRLSPKISEFQKCWYQVAGEFPHLVRTLNFIDGISDLNDESRQTELSSPVSSIRFDSVTFAYEDEPVLRDVSFQLDDSQTVAFAGPTGSGKSTIMEVLLGFYPEYKGSIYINGYELRGLDLESWWEQVSMVRQSPYIFDLTLRENVVMGRRNGSEDRLRRVLDQTMVTEFLTELDDGVDTVLGDRGVRLSGGQQQRVALARALYDDSDVLILDEATSALDYDTEQELFQRIAPVLSERIVLLVAHRLATVRGADTIYYLENSRILEQGTHKKLMSNENGYHQLYTVQSRNNE